MKLSLYYSIDTWIITLILFALMMGFIFIGRWAASRRMGEHQDNPGNTAIAGSLYGLLGLMLAFTFSMSGERFRERKATIIEEANAIGTAVLRVQLYADSVQPLFRQDFHDYLEARIRYSLTTDTVVIRDAINEANGIGDRLFKRATDQSKLSGTLAATSLMIPALNDMLDIANSRLWGELTRTPASILTMLFALSFATSFVAGYSSVGKGKFDWMMAAGFCLLTSMVIFFIIDLDKPRKGIITLDQHGRAMTELRKMLN